MIRGFYVRHAAKLTLSYTTVKSGKQKVQVFPLEESLIY